VIQAVSNNISPLIDCLDSIQEMLESEMLDASTLHSDSIGRISHNFIILIQLDRKQRKHSSKQDNS